MHTISLVTIAFNVQHTKCNMSKTMLKVRFKFGVFPCLEFIEKIPHFIASEWSESQNLGFEFMRGFNYYCVGNALGRYSIRTHYGTNVRGGVGLKEL